MKHLLYVTHSAGYRHEILPYSQEVVRELGKQSGAYETTATDNVADVDIGKSRPVGLAGRGVDAGGIGRSIGRAEHVRADHKKPVGIDRLAGADQFAPTAFSRRSALVDHLRARGIAWVTSTTLSRFGASSPSVR